MQVKKCGVKILIKHKYIYFVKNIQNYFQNSRVPFYESPITDASKACFNVVTKLAASKAAYPLPGGISAANQSAAEGSATKIAQPVTSGSLVNASAKDAVN